MAPTLAELLVPRTRDELYAALLASLRAADFPVSDWSTGGVERTELAALATALADAVSSTIPGIAGGGLVDYAGGLVAGGFPSWMPLLGAQLYNLLQLGATKTLGSILLTCAAGAGPYALADRELIIEFPSGNRYRNVGAATVPAGDSLSVSFESEFENDSASGLDYADDADQALEIVTPLPGLSATNPAPAYGAADQVGSGSGTLDLTGTPTGSHVVVVQIDGEGDAGAATWSTSIDGAAFVSQGAASSATNLGGLGINIALVDGGGSPSFHAGDTYTFECPGRWITRAGRDLETPPDHARRCKARWPSLAALVPGSPNKSFYEVLAIEASKDANGNPQVTRTLVVTDGTINNKLRVYIAGQGGILPSSVVAQVQAGFAARNMITDLPIATSPTARVINLAGAVIRVRLAQLATAKTSLQAAFARYLRGNDPVRPGGLNPLLEIGYLVSLIEATAGVTRVDDGALTINGTAEDLQLPVTAGAVEVTSWSESVADIFTWVTV